MANFSELGLNEKLVKATEALGFVEATDIQEKSIPVLLGGTKDFIGLAQTGTGKTAAYGLPLLQLTDENKKIPQVLIICPTRELCIQIEKDLNSFKKYMEKIYTVAVYGGSSISLQIRSLKRGVQIIVATPGRLIDLIERKAIELEEIRYIVLDEADEMLNMGFQEDIEFILKNTPNKESTWLFSATMPPEIRKVSRKYMKEPFEITIGKVNTTNKNIDHQYYVTQSQHRYETLKRLIDFNPGIYGIIFTRTKIDAQNISELLTREGYDIDALHGDLTQVQRDKVMKSFRNKTIKLLVATDVAARGIDVKEITHVINYELPDDPETYTHRSGRTGRAGNTGICMSIVHSREIYKLRTIEKLIKNTLRRIEIPSGKDVCRKQFSYLMDKLFSTDIENEIYKSFLPILQEKFQDKDKDEILQRVAALEFDRFLKYYENAEDLNLQEERGKRQRNERSNSRSGHKSDRFEKYGSPASGDSEYATLFVNIGTKDGFYKASFLQYILDLSDLKKDVLGRIDMKEMNSWIQIDKKAARQMIKAIDGKNYKGRKLRMNESNR